jgi:AcrR family transcriptional regulator
MFTSPRRSGVIFVDELGAGTELTMRRPTRRRAQGPADAVEAATKVYLRGDPLDMSALAAELGIGRATLYRWVGNREDLLSAVLAEGTESMFRAVAKDAQGAGPELVLDCMRRYMSTVVDAPALRALTQREPLVFIRLATVPGALETRASHLLAELIEQETATGRLRPSIAPLRLAEAIVRLCNSYLYAHLLGGRSNAQVEPALAVVSLLLASSSA